MEKRHTFYAHARYTLIYNEVTTPENAMGNPRHGFDFNLGYNFLLRNGWEFGVRYSPYSISLIGTVNGTTLTDHISLQHFGPETTFPTVKRRWTIGCAVGLGYTHTRKKCMT